MRSRIRRRCARFVDRWPLLRRLVDRWPLGVVALGWLVLIAAAVLRGGGPGHLDPIVWAFGSLTAFGTTLRLWAFPSLDARVWASAVASVIGIARSLSYAIDGAWSPLGVWVIVMGLIGYAFREVRR